MKEFIPYLRGILHEYHDVFTGNIIAQQRLKGVGILSREDAIAFGATGGTGRASGWACDVRKRMPYAVYDKVDFKEIIRTEGDSWARYLIRMDEILESLKIIEQLIDNIPEGRDAAIDVLPYGAITRGQKGAKLADREDYAAAELRDTGKFL